MDPLAVDQDYWIEGDSDLDVSPQSSEDEFRGSAGNLTESDFENDLNKTMETIQSLQNAQQGVPQVPKGNHVSTVCDGDFLSSESDNEMSSAFQKAVKKASKHEKEDDDAKNFYDPGMDDEDQEWVNERRGQNRRLLEQQKKMQKGGLRKPATSDAVLSCPACMTMLCLDCQRHETFKTQYRAMFVMNCTISPSEALRYEIPQRGKKRKRKRSVGKEHGKLVPMEDNTAAPSNGELYHQVRCAECQTDVAVCDQEEVYHFYNILASQA